jgi:hypothetical protein
MLSISGSEKICQIFEKGEKHPIKVKEFLILKFGKFSTKVMDFLGLSEKRSEIKTKTSFFYRK